MKKSLSWWALLIIAVVGYVISFALGSDTIVGDAFRLLGFLMLLFAIIVGIRAAVKRNKNQKTE